MTTAWKYSNYQLRKELRLILEPYIEKKLIPEVVKKLLLLFPKEAGNKFCTIRIPELEVK